MAGSVCFFSCRVVLVPVGRPTGLRGPVATPAGDSCPAAFPLAASSLLCEKSVDVVRSAQSLKEGDEVQELRVGRVVEPGNHGHLTGNRKLA